MSNFESNIINSLKVISDLGCICSIYRTTSLNSTYSRLNSFDLEERNLSVFILYLSSDKKNHLQVFDDLSMKVELT